MNAMAVKLELGPRCPVCLNPETVRRSVPPVLEATILGRLCYCPVCKVDFQTYDEAKRPGSE